MAEPQPQRGQPDPGQAMRRLQEALRQEMRTRSIECRYVAGCPVARAGSCPGIC